MEHKDFKGLVHQWWQELVPPISTAMFCFQQKLKLLRSKICTWNQEEFGNIFEDMKRLISELYILSQKGMMDGWDEDMQKKQKDLWGKLEATKRQEGIYWKQKSKVKWLQEGEKNTKFFHNSVIQNRHSSRILKLKNMDGG